MSRVAKILGRAGAGLRRARGSAGRVSQRILRSRPLPWRLLRRFVLLAVFLWIGWRALRIVVGAPALEAGTPHGWTQGVRVLARDGRLLGERPSDEGMRGRAVALEAISPRLVAATLTSEDRAFYDHDGVDRVAVGRALLTNVKHRRTVSGASTITSQLVKRLDHHGRPRPRTFREKVVEMARAQNLEARTDKRTILEAYFNHIDYGHGLAGPEAASRAYFGLSARDLSLAQAALLAVLPRAPSALDPYRHLDRAVVRQRALLGAMAERGVVTVEDRDRALAEPIVLAQRTPRELLAPHLVLSTAKAAQRTRATGAAEGGRANDRGEVRTTLDHDLQHDVEGIVASHASRLRDHGARNAAVVVVDNGTGEILAEVGAIDWFDRSAAGAVDLARSRRQAGSTLKPFVYARAFERGSSPMRVLADVPTSLGTTGATYAPDNFDGAFSGPISAREALAGSLNVPAVRLAVEIGPADVVAVMRGAGLALEAGAARYGPSIALGSGEVSPRELAEAYMCLARGGLHAPLRMTLDGPSVALPPEAGDRVVDPASAALVADALSDPLARVRGLRARGPFALPFPVAVKTGTSTAYRDAWTAGFTRERTVVVWTGNADGGATNKLTGAIGAGPIFTDVMRRTMRDVGARAPLYDVELVERAEVCPLSGERATEACPDRVERVFARGRTPSTSCKMHVHVARSDPRSSASSSPPGLGVVTSTSASPWVCDPHGSARAVVLPSMFDSFLAERSHDVHAERGPNPLDAHGLPWLRASELGGVGGDAPSVCVRGGGGAPAITIVAPRAGTVFHASDDPRADVVEVVAATEGLRSDLPLDVLVDGQVRLALAAPYAGRVPIDRGEHTIEVRPRDPHVAARVAHADILVR